MSAVAINPRAVVTPLAPVYFPNNKKRTADRPLKENGGQINAMNQAWLRYHLSEYHRQYAYWVDFFTHYNIKTHVTWYKYSSNHSAILDALKSTGGVGVVYERSYEHTPAYWMPTTADVVFGFSKWGAHIGRDQHSRIPYYVVTGYWGDCRFSLLQERANEVRNHLRSQGAKKIIAYFDENSSNHPRWDLAYQTTCEHYAFLLNKVLENSEFGLILKPKVPSTLRTRLEPISDLLCQAEETGRCFVFEEGALQGSYPPAVASLGADVAIHGQLFAATAGIESALSGVPTLMLDCEGVRESPLHQLRNEHVIFKDIESLWRACKEHWNRPEGVSGFGDWSDMLDELDSFRDGRAAERMGTYLEWLMEGFKDGLPRETVLADAAQRYSEMWGKDKILSVNSSNFIEGLNESCLNEVG